MSISETEAPGSGVGHRTRRVLDTITCRPYKADGGRLWYFDSAGDPIAEADHRIDAVVAITGRLAGAS